MMNCLTSLILIIVQSSLPIMLRGSCSVISAQNHLFCHNGFVAVGVIDWWFASIDHQLISAAQIFQNREWSVF
jgi:hypothetical protein